MAEKNVLVILKSRPHTTLNSYEALRVAIGLWEHRVKLLWMGEGVYSLLRDAAHGLTEKFHRDLPELGIEPYVEGRALAARGLTAEDLIPGVEPVGDEEVAELLLDAEATLVF